MMRFVILVEFIRSDGNFRDVVRDDRFDFSEVEVLATSEVDAHLTACQMVACRNDILVTRSRTSL